MELHQALVSQGSLYEAVARALPQPSTVVFSDTSVLFWLYSLGKAARREFIEWANSDLAGRFKLPVWAAHELHSHMATSPAKLTPLASEIKSVSSKMRELRRIVSLSADEINRPGLLDRREYIGELESVADRFIALCKMAGTQQPWAHLSKEIVPFVNHNVLKSDIFPALRWIQGDYSARAIGRVPPGFKDEKKPENRFGDLMLWNEIVNYCQADANLETVILITDDNKNDWVFRPETVLDELGDPQPNRKESGYETLLAPPLLTHELATVSGVQRFYIVNTSSLAIVLERYANRSIPALFAAVQPVLPAQRPPKAKAVEKPAAKGAPDAALPLAQPKSDPCTLLIDTLLQPEAKLKSDLPQLETVLANLRSRDAALQESAVASIEQATGLNEASPATWFLIGRALSEATRTELQTASNFIHRFDTATSAMANEARLSLFAGILFDLFFDGTGDPRPLPLNGDVEAIFSVVMHTSLRPSINAVEMKLAPFRDRYLATPGSADSKVPIVFSLTRTLRGGPSELTQVRQGVTDLIEDLSEGSSDLLSAHVNAANAGTISDVLQAIARRYSVPLDWLVTDQPAETKLTWAETAGFKNL